MGSRNSTVITNNNTKSITPITTHFSLQQDEDINESEKEDNSFWFDLYCFGDSHHCECEQVMEINKTLDDLSLVQQQDDITKDMNDKKQKEIWIDEALSWTVINEIKIIEEIIMNELISRHEIISKEIIEFCYGKEDPYKKFNISIQPKPNNPQYPPFYPKYNITVYGYYKFEDLLNILLDKKIIPISYKDKKWYNPEELDKNLYLFQQKHVLLKHNHLLSCKPMVVLRTLKNEFYPLFDCNHYNTFRVEICEKLQEIYNIPVERQRLIWSSTQLILDRTFNDYNIDTYLVAMHLVLRLRMPNEK